MTTTSKAIARIRFITLLSIMGLVGTLSGCPDTLETINHFFEQTYNNTELVEKAEFATGIDRRDLSVVPNSVGHGGEDGKRFFFEVQDSAGGLYKCYFDEIYSETSFRDPTTDAVCSKISRVGPGKKAQKRKTMTNG